MTLRELWESKGLTPTEVAAQARVSPTTLYRMNRKEHVRSGNVANVCRVLGISRQQYETLESERG